MGEGLKYFQFKALLQKDNWIAPAYVGVNYSGDIKYLSDVPPQEASAIEFVNGFALPGFQNAHSHAFQYAMAGLAESHSSNTHDDFWTWREAMYQCALSVDPDQAEAIAAMLYSEMLRHGYTHVAEFHYLHHDKDGKSYANLAEMGERMIAAANTAGIKITLIPVFYQKGGFGMDPQSRQRRFISKTIDEYFSLLDTSLKVVSNHANAKLGFSVHSLRAVNPDDILRTFKNGYKDVPFHLHVAEQKKEVEDCINYLKRRPARWLLENLPVNERFHLVHATHLDDEELKELAVTKANVVLCPSTEGNLGDGIFRMKEYVKLQGNWCIGTDSHIGINPLEEFRMIDYRQRLVTNQRNIFEGDSASYMIGSEIENGRRAMGLQSLDFFQLDNHFDAIVYDAKSPLLSATSLNKVLSTIVYTSDSAHTLGTIVNGRWVVRKNVHFNNERIAHQFSKAITEIKIR